MSQQSLPNYLTGGPTRQTNFFAQGIGAEFLGGQFPLQDALSALEIARGSDAAGNNNVGSMQMPQGRLFNQFADQQYGSIQRIAGGLNNQFTRDARGQVNRAMGAANQMDAMGNRAVAIGDGAGNQINALAPQVVRMGDQYMGDLRGQAFNANRQAAAAAGKMDPLAGQVVRLGDQYMGQIGGLGQMLGNQARQGFATSGPTGVEAELYRQGQRELAMGRSLSPEQLRDATQSARQGMAARGMATGNAALGAELLNRDRYATQREAQRRSFAAEANNLREKNMMDRRDAAGRLAEAGGRTLDVAGRMGMAGRETASNIYDAAGRTRLAGTEIGGRLLDQAGRMGMAGRELAGNLYDTAGRMQMSGRQIGGALLGDAGRLRLDGARTTADLDPLQRALTPGLSLGQTAMGSSADMTQGAFGNMLDLFANTGSFNINRGDSLYNSWNNNVAGVKTGNMAANSQREAANITAAATRAARPKWWETGLGAVGRIFSDERMKTDIKPVGGKNVLGLTTYEYRYKGDKKKRKGYMAQEVAEVLPEAVEEVSHNGKKRLAIKPMVIGQALAQELAAQAA